MHSYTPTSTDPFGNDFGGRFGLFVQEWRTSGLPDSGAHRQFPWQLVRNQRPMQLCISAVWWHENTTFYLVQTRRMVWITINLLHKVSHDPQLGIIATYLNVEVLHIVL